MNGLAQEFDATTDLFQTIEIGPVHPGQRPQIHHLKGQLVQGRYQVREQVGRVA